MNLAGLGVARAALARGEVTAADLVQQVEERLTADGERVNAFITTDIPSARARARELDAGGGPLGGRLRGIPVAVKDNIDTRGLRTTAGTAVHRDRIPAADAPVVRRLRAEGAVIVGKTNMDELAWGGLTDNPHYGPTRNPWDSSRFVGGSSGGSAAAVAAGLSLGAVGTDTGGSVRLPASATGTVGLRPTHGRIELDGITPLAPSMDTVGPIAHDVAGCRLLFQVLAGLPGGRDLASGPEPGGVRLGVFSDALERLEPDVSHAFEALLATLPAAGVTLVELEFPWLRHYLEPWLVIHLVEPAVVHAALVRESGHLLGAVAREQLLLGFTLQATQLAQALSFRAAFTRRIREFLTTVDALLMPTMPFAPVPHGTTSVMLGDVTEPIFDALPRFTGIASMAGMPAISLPAGLSRDGLPIGVQLVGRADGELDLLRIAEIVEEATQWHQVAGPGPAGTRRTR